MGTKSVAISTYSNFVFLPDRIINKRPESVDNKPMTEKPVVKPPTVKPPAPSTTIELIPNIYDKRVILVTGS